MQVSEKSYNECT